MALIVAGVLFVPAPCPSITLDWDVVGWPNGTLTNSYDIDPSNPGNDITITITGYVADFTGKALQINTDTSGGTNSGALNLTQQMQAPNQGAIFTVTVDFNYAGGVTNVQYLVFDVDKQANFPYVTDVLSNINAVATYGGTNIAPTTITGSPGNLVQGSGPGLYVIGVSNVANKGAGSDQGNVSTFYGANAIDSFTFSLYNARGGELGTNSISSHFALFDINYSSAGPKVPEAGVVFGPLGALAASLALLLRRKFRT